MSNSSRIYFTALFSVDGVFDLADFKAYVQERWPKCQFSEHSNKVFSYGRPGDWESKPVKSVVTAFQRLLEILFYARAQGWF